MEFTPLGNCTGRVQETCIDSRLNAQVGIEQTDRFDPDLQAAAILDITTAIGRRIIKNGCELSLTEIQQQLVQ